MHMTFGELVDAADAARSERWDHTAQLLCLLHNANRAPGGCASRMEDWHPMRQRRRVKSNYTGDAVVKVHNELARDKPVAVLQVNPSQVIEE